MAQRNGNGMLWIYVLGERSGEDVKVGHTTAATINARRLGVEREQTTDAAYVVLAGCRGTRKEEEIIKQAFEPWRRQNKGRKQEYFEPVPDVVEYAAWLRRQWWSAVTGDELQADYPVVDPSHWTPGPGRRITPPTSDPTKMVQDWEALNGSLNGTAWSWMPEPKASIQDYFTPLEIVDAARRGMGGIDLDAASHWLANRRLRIPDYFDVSRSAFENDWYGRVWLDPPYGNNAPWFARALRYLAFGEVEQLAILSPMWAFTTDVARPLMREAAATLILVPTPKFWGNAEGRTGKNHPHAIVYFGDRGPAVLRALQPFGIPATIDWTELGELRDP